MSKQRLNQVFPQVKNNKNESYNIFSIPLGKNHSYKYHGMRPINSYNKNKSYNISSTPPSPIYTIMFGMKKESDVFKLSSDFFFLFLFRSWKTPWS